MAQSESESTCCARALAITQPSGYHLAVSSRIAYYPNHNLAIYMKYLQNRYLPVLLFPFLLAHCAAPNDDEALAASSLQSLDLSTPAESMPMIPAPMITEPQQGIGEVVLGRGNRETVVYPHGVLAPLPITSHRGDMSVGMENSELAIAASAARGDKIEDIDVMVTNYGDLVLSHDDNIKDFLGQDYLIKEHSRNEIKALNLLKDISYGGGVRVYHYADTPKFAFLDEVFDKYCQQIIFWLDIKERQYRLEYNPPNDPANVLDNYLQKIAARSTPGQCKLNRIIISSTNPAIVIAIAKLAKQHGYFDQLTIGLDYSSDNAYWNRLALESGLYENAFGFNFMAAGRSILTQKIIDERRAKHQDPNRPFIIIPYAWDTADPKDVDSNGLYKVEYNRGIDSILVEYGPGYPPPPPMNFNP
jgi:glycerophosphoryl diester phosphodiesterase